VLALPVRPRIYTALTDRVRAADAGLISAGLRPRAEDSDCQITMIPLPRKGFSSRPHPPHSARKVTLESLLQGETKMTTKFTRISFPISTLLGQIETGQLGLPELQRPFVWERAQVRDLMDSLYRGYPTGYLLFWQALPDQRSNPIGADAKQTSPTLLVVDGQQRLTSLFAVFKGAPVLSSKFQAEHIGIAFNPLRERFEVANNAIQKHPEWVSNISALLAGTQGSFSFINNFIEKLRGEREVTEEMADLIAANLQRLASLPSYTFSAIQLSHDLPVEEVSEIFVRVNSKGTQLKQADFILTLMSVYWDKGRKELEQFCQSAKTPSSVASPFNWFIEPSPDQLLRVAVGLGHRRAQLKYAYELLRGKDLESGEVSLETRAKNFEILKEAQADVVDLTNFSEFLKALQEAGFRSGKMITSRNSIVYSYLIFLIGRRDYGIDFKTLRAAVARWFLMCVLTSRYTGSPETQVEKDIRRFAEAANGAEFLATLDQIVRSQLTSDFWEVTLPEQLAWSGGYVPAMFAYFASLDLLGAKVLFSNLTVHQLLDPAQIAKKRSIERHHLFPKAFLRTKGIKSASRTNQVANYALIEWPDNVKIGAAAPSDYFAEMFAKCVPESEAHKARFWHALPAGWELMDYDVFLERRRHLMAKVIRAGYAKLADGIDPFAQAAAPLPPPTVAELVAAGESETVEFKSSAFHSYKVEIPEKVISGSIVKTVAAFLNTNGGTLAIGVADDGAVLGLAADLALKSFDLDKFENALRTLLINAVGVVAANRCHTRFEKVDTHDVCLVDVDAGVKPTYADSDKGKGMFFIRAGNTTRQLGTKETVDYIAERWGVSR
jgi:hypothetical protein